MVLDVSRKIYIEEQGNEFPTKEALEVFRQTDVKKNLRNLILHMADISNSIRPFRIVRMWAWQVLEEFFLQGDLEKAAAIQVQVLNDRDKVNRPLSQIGFIEFLVAPLLFATAKVMPTMDHCVEQVAGNLKSWNA